jgi:hypothetical protein
LLPVQAVSSAIKHIIVRKVFLIFYVPAVRLYHANINNSDVTAKNGQRKKPFPTFLHARVYFRAWLTIAFGVAEMYLCSVLTKQHH